MRVLGHMAYPSTTQQNPQFSTGGASPQTLPATASAITGVTAVGTKSSYTAPTNGVTYALGVPAAPTAPTAVKLFNAAANTGMGQFTVTPTITVTVPANAYTGTYTSTLTLSIVSGP